jgi:hypothetical protein
LHWACWRATGQGESGTALAMKMLAYILVAPVADALCGPFYSYRQYKTLHSSPYILPGDANLYTVVIVY